jgi:hypothetical protein
VKITREQLVAALVDGGLIYFDSAQKHHEVAIREGFGVDENIDASLARLNDAARPPDIEITVRRVGDNVEVMQDGKTTGQLCMGEVIEQVIGLIFPDTRKVYPMHTEAEWLARFNRTTTAPEGNQQ